MRRKRRIVLAQAKRPLTPEEQTEAAKVDDRQLERAASSLRSILVYRGPAGVAESSGHAVRGEIDGCPGAPKRHEVESLESPAGMGTGMLRLFFGCACSSMAVKTA